MSYHALVKPAIKGLPVYTPGRPLEEVAREKNLPIERLLKLASNENPLGASPKARAAAAACLEGVNYYPENSGYVLTQALASATGCRPEQLTLGAGSNEIFYLLTQVFVGEGDEVVMGEYAFVTYRIATLLVGGKPVYVPMPGLCHDLTAMREAVTERTRLIFLPNPNNPTGSKVPLADVVEFVRTLPEHVVFCLDSAYAEYFDERFPVQELIAEGRKVIETRTFSKIYGLAGLRIGYGMSDPELASLLNSVRPPFNTSTLAQHAAAAALGDEQWVSESRQVNAAGLRQLESAWAEMGLEYVPSSGNFVLVRFDQAASINRLLEDLGIIVRPLAGYRLPNHLRISVGTQSNNERLIEALRTMV